MLFIRCSTRPMSPDVWPRYESNYHVRHGQRHLCPGVWRSLRLYRFRRCIRQVSRGAAPRRGCGLSWRRGNRPAKTEAEIIQMFREFYEGLFPKTCSYCGPRLCHATENMLTSQWLLANLNYDMELANS